MEYHVKNLRSMNLKLSFFNCKAMEIEFYKKILIFAFLLLFFHSAYKTFRAQTLPTRWSGHVLCLQDGVGTALPTRPSGHKACLQDGVGKVCAHKTVQARPCPQGVVGKYRAHTVLWARFLWALSYI